MSKSIFAALLIAVTLIGTSCKKDKDEIAKPEAGIAGKWKIEKIESITTMDLNEDGQWDEPQKAIQPGKAEDYMMFSTDGKCTIYVLGIQNNLFWRMDGTNKLNLFVDANAPALGFVMDIKEQTNNKLTLYGTTTDADGKYEQTIFLYR